MADQPVVPANRIVDYGHGPRVFATKVLSARMERGGGAVTLILGVEEYRGERLTEQPMAENDVFAVVGTLTLTQPACVDLVNSISGLLAGIAASKAKKPETGAN